VNILGLVSDTGAAEDASADGAWNDASGTTEFRAYVCCTVSRKGLGTHARGVQNQPLDRLSVECRRGQGTCAGTEPAVRLPPSPNGPRRAPSMLFDQLTRSVRMPLCLCSRRPHHQRPAQRRRALRQPEQRRQRRRCCSQLATSTSSRILVLEICCCFGESVAERCFVVVLSAAASHASGTRGFPLRTLQHDRCSQRPTTTSDRPWIAATCRAATAASCSLARASPRMP